MSGDGDKGAIDTEFVASCALAATSSVLLQMCTLFHWFNLAKI